MIRIKIKPKLTQQQLDRLATTFGAIASLAQLLVAVDAIGTKQGLLVSGLASIVWGWLTNQIPSPIANFKQFEKNNL
jgi:hypothetical protein